MIEFVTLETAHLFPENPLAAQHRLRYRSIILRQGWDVPFINEMEFDQYDNPAAKYLVYRDENRKAIGVSRFYPTTMPYMLEQCFANFVTERPIPKSPEVWEGSRFCIDHNLSPEIRKKIARELAVGYLETALANNVEAIVGLMYPAYWRSLFISAGWDIEFMGEVMELSDGNKARSAWLPVSQEVMKKVRDVTGIHNQVVNFGNINEKSTLQAA